MPCSSSRSLPETASAGQHPAFTPATGVVSFPPPTITIASPSTGEQVTEGDAVTTWYTCTPGAGTALEACDGTLPLGSGRSHLGRNAHGDRPGQRRPDGHRERELPGRAAGARNAHHDHHHHGDPAEPPHADSASRSAACRGRSHRRRTHTVGASMGCRHHAPIDPLVAPRDPCSWNDVQVRSQRGGGGHVRFHAARRRSPQGESLRCCDPGKSSGAALHGHDDRGVPDGVSRRRHRHGRVLGSARGLTSAASGAVRRRRHRAGAQCVIRPSRGARHLGWHPQLHDPPSSLRPRVDRLAGLMNGPAFRPAPPPTRPTRPRCIASCCSTAVGSTRA